VDLRFLPVSYLSSRAIGDGVAECMLICYSGQNCVDEHEPWIQRGAGVYLPDDLKGKVGAVYCERKH